MPSMSASDGTAACPQAIYDKPLPADICWNYRAGLAHSTFFCDAQMESGYPGNPLEF